MKGDEAQGRLPLEERLRLSQGSKQRLKGNEKAKQFSYGLLLSAMLTYFS
jgi:hypothetical protein